MTRIVFGSPGWIYWAIGFATVGLLLVAWTYSRSRAKPSVRLLCACLKALAITALAVSLLEPLLTGSRPRRGANIFVVLSDNSQSLSIQDKAEGKSRGQAFQDLLSQDSSWKTRLGQEYDVRHYFFDSQLHATDQAIDLTFQGTASSLETSLTALQKRFRGLPLAGILLLTDGNITDTGVLKEYEQRSEGGSSLPPVYPVAFPSIDARRDIALKTVTVSQTNFEAAPAIVGAEVQATGFDGQTIVATVTDEGGKEIVRQTATASTMEKPLNFRFQFRPEKRSVDFFRVNVFPAAEEKSYLSSFFGNDLEIDEQTLANNSRMFVVDQGHGPYRVLYVSGRPNWEYKFLRRAIDGDEQVNLVGLLRIAKKQPKFDFQRTGSDRTSPLFEGFDNVDEETVEQRDQPVLVRLGTRDETELRDGFPRSAAELFQYHAIIIDDLEATFFTQDQLTLLRNFVSVRGGGLLMLGGASSFADGGYDRTTVGDLLPVYLGPGGNRTNSQSQSKFRFLLTREGWLQPWTRTRQTEEEEKQRIAAMPEFSIVSPASSLKPGAYVLAEAKDEVDRVSPALVAQQFGQGHVAALLIGDLWRWALSRKNPAEDDFDRAWRQTVRWLISNVPERVELEIKAAEADPEVLRLETRVRDQDFRFLDNARVEIRVTPPNGEEVTLATEPHDREPGLYTTGYSLREPGAYRFVSVAVSPEGAAIGKSERGWAAQPGSEEFSRLAPNDDYLRGLAAQTGGDMVDANDMGSFVESLSTKKVPIEEPWTSPLWHQPIYFLFTIGCLIAEWGLRRVNGLT